MAFVELPRRTNIFGAFTSSDVWVYFRKVKNSKNSVDVDISIGSKVAKLAGISALHKVQFFYDDECPSHWLIKKSDSKNKGYKFTAPEVTKNYISFRLRLRVPDFKLEDDDFCAKTVQHTVAGGGLILQLETRQHAG